MELAGFHVHSKWNETEFADYVRRHDFLVVDMLLAPFDQFYRAAGVNAFDGSAVWFHFKGSLRGMVLGLPACLIAGLFVTLL